MDSILEYNCDKQLDLWNDGATIVGYGSVFYQEGNEGTEYVPMTGFVERVSPGAFRGLIARGDDVWAAVNHNMEQVLGRRNAGTLTIEEDDVGLRYKIDLPDTTLGRDTRAGVKHGNFTGSSIGFVPAEGGVKVTKEGGVTVRTITEVARLRDVGPVHSPAFKGTSVSARSQIMFSREIEAQLRDSRMEDIAERMRQQRMEQIRAGIDKLGPIGK